MARRVTILINDDGTSQIESDVTVEVTPSPAPTPVPEQETDPAKVLSKEFLEAIKRNRKGAFEALGFERVSHVPAEKVEEKIALLRAVVKVPK